MSAFKDRPGSRDKPGEDSREQGKSGLSWAQLLGSTIPTSMNKNILEVVLEKDLRGAFVVSELECARLMKRIGLDQLPGGHLEGVQICPNGRGVIYITLKENIKLEKFCRYDIIAVTESGIRATMIKPALKKEVVINIKGLHPNTRDSTVLEYLSKFGKVVTTKVVHRTYNEGPLEGIKNGDRAFKMEVRSGENIGSFHFLDGQKITLRYSGQQQTCGRCHEVPHKCKGKGVAKRCEAEGGEKVEFTDYILALWKRIGYAPTKSDSESVAETEDSDETVTSFTPVKIPTCDLDKYAGVSIRQLPHDTDHGEVVEFLCKKGLPDEKKDGVTFKENGVVEISDLDSNICRLLIEAIHGKEMFGRKVFCNGVIPLTPDKPAPSAESLISPAQAIPSSLTLSATTVTAADVAASSFISDKSASSKSPAFLAAVKAFKEDESDLASNTTVVRRHSLSLTQRTPPRNSIAAEILDIPRVDFLRTQEAMNDLKEQLSEFGSCLSSSESSGESGGDHSEIDKTASEGFKTVNEKKRSKRNKRKFKLTPGKESFLKKPNLTGPN